MAKKRAISEINKDISVEELQKIKLNVEIAKLQEETNQIKKPWFRQPTFLSVLASITVPILTLVLAYFFGGGKEYFDAQRLNLEYDKKILSGQVDQFKKDTIGLDKKYAIAAKKLLKDHIKDSLRLSEKLADATIKLNSKERSLNSVTKQLDSSLVKLKYDKAIYSAETIINQFIKGNGLWSARGMSEFDQLITYLKQTKERRAVLDYFKTLTDDINQPVLTRCTILEVTFFAYGDDSWKQKFLKVIDNNIIKEINTDTSVRSIEVESFLTLLHRKEWSAVELHDNNKFIVNKVLDVFPSYKGNFDRLSELLMGVIDQDFEYLQRRRSYMTSNYQILFPPRLYYKLADTLMEPSNDSETFINLLVACRMFWHRKSLTIGERMSNLSEKFENIFTAFLSEKAFGLTNPEDRYNLINNYYNFLHPNFLNAFNTTIEMTSTHVDTNEFKKEIDSLASWRKAHLHLCERLNEKNLQTYRSNINLLINDCAYNKNKMSQ